MPARAPAVHIGGAQYFATAATQRPSPPGPFSARERGNEKHGDYSERAAFCCKGSRQLTVPDWWSEITQEVEAKWASAIRRAE